MSQASMRRVGAVLWVLAALAYSAWMLQPLTGSSLDMRTSYVSELYALGQPWSAWLRAADAVAGLAVLGATALLWWRGWVQGTRWSRRFRAVVLVAAGLFGLATFTDSRAPMACVATVDAACRAGEAAGTLPLHHTVHVLSSSVAGTGSTAAALALAVAMFLERRRAGTVRWQVVAAVVVGVAGGLCMAWTLWEYAVYSTPALVRLGTGTMGWAQRAQLATVAAWSILMATDP